MLTCDIRMNYSTTYFITVYNMVFPEFSETRQQVSVAYWLLLSSTGFKLNPQAISMLNVFLRKQCYKAEVRQDRVEHFVPTLHVQNLKVLTGQSALIICYKSSWFFHYLSDGT